MGSTSIAIWNGNKFAIALAGGVWVTNLGFLAQSKPLPLPTMGVSHSNM